MNGGYFALMVDEWSDIKVNPHVAIIVKFFDVENQKISQEFLEILELEKTDAETIYQTIKKSIESFSLDLSKCVAFASDGASVVAGINNYVFTKLRNHSPNITQIKCVCHSLNLCIAKAFEVLPSCLSFILKSIPKWFAKSYARKNEYDSLFATMAPDDKPETSPFAKYSETRWLARGKVINGIIENWDHLIQYFTQAIPSLTGNAKFNAMVILENLNITNLAYFKLLYPIVDSFERTNQFFQKKEADPFNACEEVDILYKSLLNKVQNRRQETVVPELTDFGEEFKAMNPPQIVIERGRLFAR